MTHWGSDVCSSSLLIQAAPSPGEKVRGSWRLIRARSRLSECWRCLDPGWARISLTIMTWVSSSMSRMEDEDAGPANTTHS